jgi:hypothetical protein
MKKDKSRRKETYVEPKVLASYKKEELEEIIRPHGTPQTSGGGGCGCGGGSILIDNNP